MKFKDISNVIFLLLYFIILLLYFLFSKFKYAICVWIVYTCKYLFSDFHLS